MILEYKNRPVEVAISGSYDEPMVESGNYTDGAMEDLTEEECVELGELYAGEIATELAEWAMSNAYDRAKDLRKYGE